MTTSAATSLRSGRLLRALVAYSAHTAESYIAVWGPGRSTAPERLIEPLAPRF
jgi:hypothetical protein